MRVFLTGGSGFVGARVLSEVVARGHQVRCLLRDTSVALATDGPAVERVRGDVSDPASLRGSMRGCDAVIHLVGILDEKPRQGVTFEAVHDSGTRNVVREAMDEDIATFIHMSANGAAREAQSGYQRTKWKAEQHVTDAGFDHWTIFRPSIIFGDPGDHRTEFASRLLQQLIRPFPVLPMFGDGSFEIQPIAVDDVARAFAQALSKPESNGKTYCVAGESSVSYRDALDIIARGAGLKPRPKIPQPIGLVRAVVRVASPTGLLPVSPDQFEMLIAGNTCDASAFQTDFRPSGPDFTPEALGYLKNR